MTLCLWRGDDMNIKINMPENVEMILNKLSADGHEAVIVGGCVRDSIMGLEPHDWDIATSALPEEIIACFGDFQIMTAGLKHGTVTIIINHEPYEITTYRIDGKYTDFRRPDFVSFTGKLSDDIERRDFTINAMAYDGENIIDFHDGILDLERGIIKCVGNADDRFREDPLRIMRAIRFAARFGFTIESDTAIAMRRNAHLLDKIAMERKQSEFSKAICSNHIDVLKNYADILSYVMPGLSEIEDFETIIDMVGECKNLEEKLAIFIDSLGITVYNNVIKLISGDMKYPNKITKSVCNIVTGKNYLMTNSELYVKNMLFLFPLKDVEYILNYKYAKIKYSKIEKDTRRIESDIENIKNIARRIADKRSGECYNFKGLAINGRDLKELGVEDLEIKKYLTELLHLVTTNQIENNKESLIEVVKISLL